MILAVVDRLSLRLVPDGLWRQVHHALLDELGSQGLIDWSRAIVDGACVRAKKGAP